MARRNPGLWLLTCLILVGVLGLAACAPAAAPAPTAAPAKPAAAPTTAPAAPAPTTAAAPAATAAPAAPAPTAAAKPAAQPIELRIGSSFVKEDWTSQTLDRFADTLNKKSGGQIVARVFYQSLGAEQQLIQAVQTGGADMGTMSDQNTARFSDTYLIKDLPFLFKDNDGLLKFISSPQGQKMVVQAEKDLQCKLILISSYGSMRDIQTNKKQLKAPADIKGVKIRVVSTPVDLATFSGWGANPTPIDWGQTYTAMQQGVVDGVNLNLLGYVGAKFWEVTKYYLKINYQGNFQQLLMSQKKFDSLTAEQKKWITDSAAEVQAWNWTQANKDVDGAFKLIAEQHGQVVYTPTKEEYAQWIAPREQIWKDAIEKIGASKIDMNAANAIFKEYNQ